MIAVVTRSHLTSRGTLHEQVGALMKLQLFGRGTDDA